MRESKLRKPTKYWLGKERIDFKGEKNFNWNGGTTSIEKMIRNCEEYKNWRMIVYKRDYFSCQDCGSKKNIEAHHLNSFSDILKGFLSQYAQFSPMEDKETLLKLSTTYEEFWNIDNGKTLCEHCHKSLKRCKEAVNG